MILSLPLILKFPTLCQKPYQIQVREQRCKEEMAALEQNEIWDFVCLPSGKKAFGCWWMYMVKLNPDGSLDHLKACLVTKGYSHMSDIDY